MPLWCLVVLCDHAHSFSHALSKFYCMLSIHVSVIVLYPQPYLKAYKVFVAVLFSTIVLMLTSTTRLNVHPIFLLLIAFAPM